MKGGGTLVGGVKTKVKQAVNKVKPSHTTTTRQLARRKATTSGNVRHASNAEKATLTSYHNAASHSSPKGFFLKNGLALAYIASQQPFPPALLWLLKPHIYIYSKCSILKVQPTEINMDNMEIITRTYL